ncbi:hypothetical protein GIB67_004429 [Kingdonia uniflora]|uniref:Chalcone isomerase domain-containing protein n=1 Tax=Kingdonia uniflora TaxID=39325 RepID=A0A7J7MRF3_9MAGN|nr:hypothetical protein GIB67_004429 [Kingdonia uniflora]
MAALVEEITKTTQVLDIGNKSNVHVQKEEMAVVEKKLKLAVEQSSSTLEEKPIKKEVAVEVEPKTGVSFPVELSDKMKLYGVGIRKRSFFGIGLKIYGYGIYADTKALKELVRSKVVKAPAKATKEIYQAAIDSDVEMTLRMVVIYGGLTMGLVRKNFDDTLGTFIRKYNGGQNDDTALKKIMGEEADKIKLTAGSVIEFTKLPGYILQTKVMDEAVGKVESELVCRAFFDMYLGDDAFDNNAKEKFGMSLISLI